MNKAKLFSVFALLIVVAVAFSGLVAAVPAVIDSVKVDGTELSSNSVNKLNVERGEEIEVKVTVTATGDSQDVEIEAFISGYEYNDKERMSDTSNSFDIENSTIYVKTLKLDVPTRVDEDNYKLRVMVSDRNSGEIIQNYNIKIDAKRHQMQIRDVVLSPENEVKAGSALLATVRIRNLGDRDEESVKVKISIPSLGLSDSDYIDEIELDDSETSADLYVVIPKCSKPGVYDVVTKVEYDDGYEELTKVTSIEVVEGDSCTAAGDNNDGNSGSSPSLPDVVAGSTFESVVQGEGGAIYPITITNNGKSSKAFSVIVGGAEAWGSVQVSPSNTVIIKPGKSESVYIFVGAKDDAAPGNRVFTASVKTGSDVVEQVTLTANIVESGKTNWNGAKKGLEIALVVLVALLVILGLIIGFSKLKEGDENMPGADAETYY
jgi:uncharacterized membrane protein